MIADDDMYMRHLAKMGLESFATIYEVTEGDQVVNAYRKWMPDILFLDIHLPGKMGTDILQEILQIDKSAYVVMLSADSSPENIRLAAHKGAKDFVSKPFTRERMLENMKKCPTLGLEVRREILKRA
jgi:two-component system chemotaxis response regulator CheY